MPARRRTGCGVFVGAMACLARGAANHPWWCMWAVIHITGSVGAGLCACPQDEGPTGCGMNAETTGPNRCRGRSRTAQRWLPLRVEAGMRPTKTGRAMGHRPWWMASTVSWVDDRALHEEPLQMPPGAAQGHVQRAPTSRITVHATHEPQSQGGYQRRRASTAQRERHASPLRIALPRRQMRQRRNNTTWQ